MKKLFLISLLPILIVGCSNNEQEKSYSSTSTEPRVLGFSYYDKEDPMVKGSVHYGYVLSTNTLNFHSPYDQEQHSTLLIRNHPKSGKNIMLQIERGQFLCRSYERCKVHVRFDDNESQTYSGLGPSDYSSDTVFILDESRFLKNMMKSKRVRISTEVYQEGSPVFDFDVSTFNPDPLNIKINKN